MSPGCHLRPATCDPGTQAAGVPWAQEAAASITPRSTCSRRWPSTSALAPPPPARPRSPPMARAAFTKRVIAGQRGGGREIRTREGLPPTRFPTLLTSVQRRPPPSVACPNTIWATAGERCRTGMNETKTEPSYVLGVVAAAVSAAAAGAGRCGMPAYCWPLPESAWSPNKSCK